ncbi:BFD domain protein (2Fe-2S)-binding domain protein [Hydrogenophaga taeniospiralis CCUG 15921]|uniref:BFD domain protein (2Fe-2S)-binding domain protein n=1 Tax=Hydrogenophaga taeniospiralis CCUG 15921 TaxID=1281780 RepID=A0A9X4NPL0_9BURK|nr:FAD/NAD(P)-binding oxidoreductase [Hydrogenophaga taeniospiralis]MDG5975022.1 BFD domain protein (2Fe-2S)-binding domain protein [Hydrogenophaga taeniospiralis CCUG 15921]
MAQPRVIIVGAGPAGVRCAQTLVAAGLRPTVIDENRRDGGQIYRRQPDNFTRPYAQLYGTEAGRAEALHTSFDALREQVDYRPGTLAWNVFDKKLHVVKDEISSALPYDALVICSGATDRLMPVKGWQLAGTYSLGAAQIALKAQACAIGQRVVFMGTGPLLYLVAAQYLKAGAQVAAVLDTSPFARRIAALPKLLARPAVLFKGLALVARIRRAGVPVLTGVTPVEITGSPDAGVQGVAVREAGGATRRFECDAVAMGYHLRPETQLADLARCAFRFDAETRQWLPEVGEDGRTSVPGVYLAGDGARVLGADAAETAGRLAAMAVLKDFGLPTSQTELQRLRAEQAGMERFRQGLAQAFPWPQQQAAQLPDEAIVCRCETITAGELRRVVCDMGAQEANRAKALSRVGMGRCQGRYCGHAGAEVIAHAAGVPVEQVGRLRGQAPVKPLSIAVREETE